MISRRSFLGGAAAAAFATPSILLAHTEEPFVLAEEFQPREVRVREQHAPGPPDGGVPPGVPPGSTAF